MDDIFRHGNFGMRARQSKEHAGCIYHKLSCLLNTPSETNMLPFLFALKSYHALRLYDYLHNGLDITLFVVTAQVSQA